MCLLPPAVRLIGGTSLNFAPLALHIFLFCNTYHSHWQKAVAPHKEVLPDLNLFLCAKESNRFNSDSSDFTPSLLTVPPGKERDTGNIAGVIAVFKLQI